MRHETTVVTPPGAEQQADSTPPPVQAAGLAGRSILVTTGVPISDSGNQQQRIVLSASVFLGGVASGSRVTLSSLPDTNAPIIVDNHIVVNGHHYSGYLGVTGNPRDHVGENPEICYKGIDALDITNDLRVNGTLFLEAYDYGGYYCCSRLYVRVEP